MRRQHAWPCMSPHTVTGQLTGSTFSSLTNSSLACNQGHDSQFETEDMRIRERCGASNVEWPSCVTIDVEVSSLTKPREPCKYLWDPYLQVGDHRTLIHIPAFLCAGIITVSGSPFQRAVAQQVPTKAYNRTGARSIRSALNSSRIRSHGSHPSHPSLLKSNSLF